MVIRKTLGIVLAALGIIGIAAWSVPDVKNAIPTLNTLGDTPLIIVSGVLAVVGIFMLVGRSRRNKGGGGEVPIYHGRNIVGYRRQ